VYKKNIIILKFNEPGNKVQNTIQEQKLKILQQIVLGFKPKKLSSTFQNDTNNIVA
jgi:hypothetical protein